MAVFLFPVASSSHLILMCVSQDTSFYSSVFPSVYYKSTNWSQAVCHVLQIGKNLLRGKFVNL